MPGPSRPKRSTPVRSMNISIFVAGSSRRNVATASQASRRTRAHSLPCWRAGLEDLAGRELGLQPVEDDLGHDFFPASGAFSRPGELRSPMRADGRRAARRSRALGLDGDLAVALAALDALLQHHQAVEHLLGPRRAAGDVDVDRHDLVGARHGRVVLVEAAGRGAHAERDDPLRLAHLIVDAAQGRALALGDGADDDQQVGLAGREARELGAEAGDVVLRRRDGHELHAAAGGHERVLEERELARPVDRVCRACRCGIRNPCRAFLLPADGALAPDVGQRDDQDGHEDEDLAEPEERDAARCRRPASSGARAGQRAVVAAPTGRGTPSRCRTPGRRSPPGRTSPRSARAGCR